MKRLVICLLMLIIPAAVSAAGSLPVPTLPAVTLVSTTGAEISTDKLGTEKTMVLVLVTKGNPAGERLLSFLEDVDGLPSDRVAIIIGGADNPVAAAVAARHPELDAQWYSDPEEKVAKGVKLQATPITMGIRNAAVAWTVLGLHDQEKMEKTLRGWVR